MIGMSHPQIDFRAIPPRSQSKLIRQLAEGKSAGYFSNQSLSKDADQLIERFVRDGAMIDPVFARKD